MKLMLLLSFVCTVYLGMAQRDNPESLPVKGYELIVKTVAPSSLRLPFNSIKIIDSRFDTSKIGFLYKDRIFANWHNEFRIVKLNPCIQQGIENFYNIYYQSNFIANDKTLLIVIKKLWISDVASNVTEDTRYLLEKKINQFVYAKFEYYAGMNNAYVPLKRIDTTFQLSNTRVSESYDPQEEVKLPFLCYALETMIETIKYDNYFSQLADKKTFGLSEIFVRNATQQHFPILRETISQGVFLTFDEFKNNAPSMTRFRKTKMLKKNMYEITDDKNNAITRYYAYSDGQHLEMYKPLSSFLSANISQDNPLVFRSGNTFEFFELTGNRSRETIQRSPQFVLIPRQIDMETGLAY